MQGATWFANGPSGAHSGPLYIVGVHLHGVSYALSSPRIQVANVVPRPSHQCDSIPTLFPFIIDLATLIAEARRLCLPENFLSLDDLRSPDHYNNSMRYLTDPIH